jgi:hypothetical protein
MSEIHEITFGELEVGQGFKVVNSQRNAIHPRTPRMLKTPPVPVSPQPNGLNPSSRSSFHNVSYEIRHGSPQTAFFRDGTKVVPI